MGNEATNVTLEALLQRIVALEAKTEACAAKLSESTDISNAALDASWVYSSAILVAFMQLGFALLEAGSVRAENVIATYSKNILDMMLGVFAGAFGGYQFAFPDNDIFVMEFRGTWDHHHVMTSFFFYLMFQATAATIVSGGMAERTSILGYLIYSVFISGIVYSSAVRLTWGGGWLATQDPSYHDFAGSGVVHLVGGTSAIIGCIFVGSRTGRWDPVTIGEFAPNNIPYVFMGTMILWVGWYGFNPGSVGAISGRKNLTIVSNIFINTTFAGASAGAVYFLSSLAHSRFKNVDALGMCNAILGGLVAITAGCDIIDPPYAIVVGASAALVYKSATKLCRLLHIDDVVQAFPVHGACGAWGVLVVGLFDRDAGLLFGNGGAQLRTQAVGICILVAISAVPNAVVLYAINRMGGLRVSPEDEARGLDSKLGLKAYHHKSTVMIKYRSLAHCLQTLNMKPHMAVETLESLKGIIHRPFTPQGGDNVLKGEVDDILDHFDFHDDESCQYLSFLSHHKADAGDAARIFVDQARRRLLANLKPRAANSHKIRENRISILKRLREENYVFLDSTNLKDLDHLLDYVAQSQNHLVLMTRDVLERPWVLAELIHAHNLRKNMVCVLVRWNAQAGGGKAFNFPEDLDKAIRNWKEFALQQVVEDQGLGFSFSGELDTAIGSMVYLKSSVTKSDSVLRTSLSRLLNRRASRSRSLECLEKRRDSPEETPRTPEEDLQPAEEVIRPPLDDPPVEHREIVHL